MPVTYTNRKGHTYYLCQGKTKTGKMRFYFARQPKEGFPDQIPEGYRISESVNGVFGKFSPLPPEIVNRRLQEQLDKSARFSPILRFILIDPEERKFITERWSYLGNVEDWIDMGESGKLEKLARRLIPKLGTDDFFELF
jgi:hypothetical protein